MAIEKELEIEIPDEIINRTNTLDQVLGYLRITSFVMSQVAKETGKKKEEIMMHTTLRSLDADDVDIGYLAIELEEKFGLEEIPDEQIQEYTTVGQIIDYLFELLYLTEEKEKVEAL